MSRPAILAALARALWRDSLLLLGLALILLCLLWASVSHGQGPEGAVVRIKSHGASGVVIESGPGRSLILSCGHMFAEPADYARPFVIDGPGQPLAPVKLAKATLLRVDKERDLSLIELANGPFYSLPLGPPGHHCQSVELVSLGYDEMRWPCTVKAARYLVKQGDTIFTRQPPWHGRSGGALYDPHGKCLVGICQGYEGPYPAGRGMYVSLSTIHVFLGQQPAQTPLPGTPQTQPYWTPPPAGPGGVCPIPGKL